MITDLGWDVLNAVPQSERLANLVVRTDNLPAISAHQSWGWKAIGQEQPFPDAPVMDSMVRVLSLS